MSRDPKLMHPLDFNPNENLEMTEKLLAFVTDFPNIALQLYYTAFEDMQLEEKMEKLEQERQKMKKKKLSTLKALRQLKDYNMKGITELPEFSSTPIRKKRKKNSNKQKKTS